MVDLDSLNMYRKKESTCLVALYSLVVILSHRILCTIPKYRILTHVPFHLAEGVILQNSTICSILTHEKTTKQAQTNRQKL